MSSTFARPADLLGTARRPRLRRRSDNRSSSRSDNLVATDDTRTFEPAATVCVGAGAMDNTVARRSVLPFLRTPANWQIIGSRPVSYLDHVVLTPSAVLAVTTRFYLAAEGDEHVQRAWGDIRTAKGAAKLLELTIGTADVPAPAEVRPVLVLWGPGAPELENGYLLVKGVIVLDPSQPQLWAHLFDSPKLADDTHAALVEALRTLQVNSSDTPITLAG